MAVKNEYNTKARMLIMDFLTENSEVTVSAQDILSFLASNGINISFTTVYRYLNKLTCDKKVIKINDGNTQRALYQLSNNNKSCDNHLHIKCISCGKLLHLDCEFMKEMSNHLLDAHGFNLECEGSILYGKCNNCCEK